MLAASRRCFVRVPTPSRRRPRRLRRILPLAVCGWLGVAATVGTLAAAAPADPVTLEVGEPLHRIHPTLFGLNLGFAVAHDPAMADGRVEGLLRLAGIRALRYPGGTETSFHHWRQPNVRQFRDLWETDPDRWWHWDRERFGTGFLDNMNVVEFLRLCERLDAVPIVGVNALSGIRTGRLDDSLEEAAALVRFCNVENGFGVRHWFIDNELWHPEKGEFKHTAAEYLRVVERFAAAMRAVDPSIRVIADWHSWQPLADVPGPAPADAADMHWYWKADADIESMAAEWASETPLRTKHADRTLPELAERFRASSAMAPLVLEYNGGGSFNTPATRPADLYEGMLIVAEMLQQMMEAGIEIACLYPGLEVSRVLPRRGLFDPDTLEPLPLLTLFQLLGPTQGATYRSVAASAEGLLAFAADQPADHRSAGRWVYAINKTDEELTLRVNEMAPSGLPLTQVHRVRRPDHPEDPVRVEPVYAPRPEDTADARPPAEVSLPPRSLVRLHYSDPTPDDLHPQAP